MYFISPPAPLPYTHGTHPYTHDSAPRRTQHAHTHVHRTCKKMRWPPTRTPHPLHTWPRPYTHAHTHMHYACKKHSLRLYTHAARIYMHDHAPTRTQYAYIYTCTTHAQKYTVPFPSRYTPQTYYPARTRTQHAHTNMHCAYTHATRPTRMLHKHTHCAAHAKNIQCAPTHAPHAFTYITTLLHAHSTHMPHTCKRALRPYTHATRPRHKTPPVHARIAHILAHTAPCMQKACTAPLHARGTHTYTTHSFLPLP